MYLFINVSNYFFGGADDWTQGLLHGKQALLITKVYPQPVIYLFLFAAEDQTQCPTCPRQGFLH